MTSSDRPALTDRRGMGGIIAQDGFDYQVWDALARLPAWLRDPSFEGLAFETLEDVEVRFFAPHTPRGRAIDRFQAKSGEPDRSTLLDLFEAFKRFDEAYPQAARVHTLVTRSLPAKLNWIARDQDRVRRARPFYAPFADITAESDARLRLDLEEEFGSELGNYVADHVDVAIVAIGERRFAQVAFAIEMERSFPGLELSSKRQGDAFSALCDLANEKRGEILTRGLLLDSLASTLGVDPIPERKSLRLHVRSDRNEEVLDALQIDGSGFSGGTLGYPEPETWRSGLLAPLETTASWARANGFQRIALTGSYRLSTAIALGWSFRSAIGFEIDIPTRSGIWPTDAHPTATDETPPWSVRGPGALVGDALVVGIGVLRDPTPDIVSAWGLQGSDNVLTATLAQALTGATETQSSVRVIKSAIAEAAARLRPKRIDLCIVGPAALAVALGHRWNGLAPTQLYEFLATEARYVPTARLS